LIGPFSLRSKPLFNGKACLGSFEGNRILKALSMRKKLRPHSAKACDAAIRRPLHAEGIETLANNSHVCDVRRVPLRADLVYNPEHSTPPSTS